MPYRFFKSCFFSLFRIPMSLYLVQNSFRERLFLLALFSLLVRDSQHMSCENKTVIDNPSSFFVSTHLYLHHHTGEVTYSWKYHSNPIPRSCLTEFIPIPTDSAKSFYLSTTWTLPPTSPTLISPPNPATNFHRRSFHPRAIPLIHLRYLRSCASRPYNRAGQLADQFGEQLRMS